MDEARFNKIVEEKRIELTGLMSPFVGMKGGGLIFYNAYFNGTEVVVAGYQRPDETGTGTLTKPVAIMVDDQVFDALRVDDERSRVDRHGDNSPKKVV